MKGKEIMYAIINKKNEMLFEDEINHSFAYCLPTVTALFDDKSEAEQLLNKAKRIIENEKNLKDGDFMNDFYDKYDKDMRVVPVSVRFQII
jgi:hypothetical protein